MAEQRFLKCTRDAVEDFTIYDKNSDVVTCWEYFSLAYSSYFPRFEFDRFPSYKSGGEEWMNPDFTIFFDDRYAIAAITLHREGVCKAPSLFDDLLNQLCEIDGDFKFKDGDGNFAKPKSYDIALLSDSGHSQTLGHKIRQSIDTDDLDVSANIIVLEFDYLEEAQSKYRFKRLSDPSDNFRDDVLPNRGKISQKLSIQGGTYENIQIPLDEDFTELKATGMFTNKPTSDLYLACRLWDTVIKDELTDDEWAIWRKGDPNRAIQKVVSCEELSKKINQEYVPEANISKENIKDALRFIAVAKRAVQVSDDEFQVDYSNLRDKRRKHKDAASERSDIEDLAYLLASWHCEVKVGNSLKEIADIITTDDFNKADLSGLAGANVMDY
ncbi:hypothetical protein [Natronobiforma cellulositropha]|uniref:hypothetical protein n=1 Tax=Natronobiforma cellulositropha TaxID=1679076 RepID=UPI0021D57939|nr:hypothetical protein [Natronobiforma cellulositropha]